MAIALGLVLASGMAHSIWNLFTKTSRNKTVFLWLIHLGGCAVFLPFLIHDISSGIPIEGYGLMAVTILFQMGYMYLLPIAYERADMSQAYPVMRGVAALCVPLLGIWIYDEYLTFAGWLGVAAIVAGLFAIGGLRLAGAGRRLAALWPILLVGVMITGYTLNDKMLLEYISPLSLIFVSNLGSVIVLFRSSIRSKAIRAEWSANWHSILIGTILSPGSYLLFLFAMKLGPVSQLAPIREISTVFGTLLGIWLLKEAHGRSRVLFAAVITTGIVTIGIWGT
ncbi:DMT family transporter [Paenibacillus sp. LHD-117]|uniref:DMT family transporter n=1 Tax=Paenibacillus sp. LHD-117 TaxID=3071412 RepID=UPI0027DF7099|nr:DMT family transporter [Paenibacillus sp. LHD-117]MDQ6419450.1 DMT family transporter [Paenibacillus sp. LHD-117]